MLKVKIIYVNEQAESLGIGAEYILGDGFVDLKKVESFIEFIKNGRKYPYTELFFKSGNSLVIDMNIQEVEKLISIPQFDIEDLKDAFWDSRNDLMENFESFSSRLWLTKYRKQGYSEWT